MFSLELLLFILATGNGLQCEDALWERICFGGNGGFNIRAVSRKLQEKSAIVQKISLNFAHSVWGLTK